MDDPSQIVHEYFHKLGLLIDTFDFTRQGHGESMGKDAAGIVAEGILDRSVNDQGGPDGIWIANDYKYTTRKLMKYNVELIGFRTGQMISLPSLLGRLEIEPTTVMIYYGTGFPPSRSMSANYISGGDKRITDVQKAGYFTTMKGRWFAIDDKISGEVREYFANELGGFIRELNAR